MIQSEFVVRTVRVFKVEPHHNANKLDILTVGEEYPFPSTPVIVTKGDFKEGDICVYISPDSILPLSDVRWTFLRTRAGWVLDGKGNVVKVGRADYRVRPMTLRGVKSWGLVTHTHHTSVGIDVAEEMGITKYENDAQVENSKATVTSGTKVGASWLSRIFTRLFPSEKRHLNTPVYGVANLRFTNPFEPNEGVLYTEKLHGTNVRFVKLNGKLYVGSHRVWKTDNRSRIAKFFSRKVQRHWYKGDLWTETVERCVDIDNLPENVVFYGEIVGKYNGKDIQPGFNYGFESTAVYLFTSCFDIGAGEWCYTKDFIPLGRFVPRLYAGGFSTARVDVLSGDSVANVVYSEIDQNTMLEGIVLHSTTRPGVAAKWVSRQFKERE